MTLSNLDVDDHLGLSEELDRPFYDSLEPAVDFLLNQFVEEVGLADLEVSVAVSGEVYKAFCTVCVEYKEGMGRLFHVPLEREGFLVSITPQRDGFCFRLAVTDVTVGAHLKKLKPDHECWVEGNASPTHTPV